MKLKQLTQALADANIPFTFEGKNHDEVYIDDVLVVFEGNAFIKPHQSTTCFNTTGSKPLADVELKDLQPMIQHYRKFHPALPEISSGGDNEKEFHVLIVTRRKDGSAGVYNYSHIAKNRLAIFNYFLKKFDPEEIETLTILEENEA